ncbi:MAG: sigma-E processing peptidase SpoIIGA [Roseburia sp.]|nr:sigma-E processing peptidase SpoIIGA [Roseburia sp.]
MDLIAVCGANYFLKRRKKYRRLIPAAAVTSFLGLVLLVFIRNYLLYCLITHFLLNTFMTALCFGRCGKKEFIENFAVIYFVVILLGGILEWLQGSGMFPQNFFLMALAGIAGICVALFYLMRRKNFGNHIVEVRICKDCRNMELRGYWDSGNQLRDPYTGQGISILSHAKAREFVDEKKDRIRFVPYRSLGETEGLLAVLDVDEMVLKDGKKRQELRHMAIGIAQKGLLEDKAYDLILHASLG